MDTLHLSVGSQQPQHFRRKGLRRSCQRTSLVVKAAREPAPYSTHVLAAVKEAKEQARQHGTLFATPDHLLLGLLSDDNAASRLLQQQGLQHAAVQERLDKQHIAPLVVQLSIQDVELSRDAKAGIMAASAYAENSGSPCLASPHLLAALLQLPSCSVAKLLLMKSANIALLEDKLDDAIKAEPEAVAQVPSAMQQAALLRQQYELMRRQQQQQDPNSRNSGQTLRPADQGSQQSDDDIYN